MSNHGNLEQGKEFRKLASLNFLYEINEFGKVRNVKSKRIKTPIVRSNGCVIMSFKINRRMRCKTLASLVAEAWLGERPADFDKIIHKDGNKANNHYKNLSYAKGIGGNDCYPKLVEITDKNGISYSFESFRACARYIAQRINKAENTIRSKFSQRRSHIYDYEVNYFPVCRD